MLNDGGIESTISIYFTMFHGKTHVIATGPRLQWQALINVITISGSPGSVSGSGGSCYGQDAMDCDRCCSKVN